MTQIPRSEKVLFMRIILTIFILIISLQSWARAEDIRNFQIEGMSIGDSLLDYFSVEEINISKKYDHTNTNWTSDKMFQLRTGKKGRYTEIMFALKKNDKKYIIYGIDGLVKMEHNISECFPKLEKVSAELKELFPNTNIKKEKVSHRADSTGKSKVKSVYFNFSSGDFASVQCYDWSEKMGYWDNFRIGIITKEFNNWISSNY